MNGRNLRYDLFFYLGILLICAPFMKTNTVYLPLVFLGAWLLRRFASFAEDNRPITLFRVRLVNTVLANRLLTVGLILAVAFLLPFASSNYLLDVLTSAILYAILATALNITVGLTGVLVLGFIGFYAVGAYTTGILTAKFALCGFWVALPLSGLVAMLCGILLGVPALRLKGDYLAVVTLGFGEIIRIFLTNLNGLTGGPNGILGIKRPSFGLFTLDHPRDFYWFVLAMLALVVLIVSRLANSRYGRAWVAIRENEMAAGALGINVFRKHLLSLLPLGLFRRHCRIALCSQARLHFAGFIYVLRVGAGTLHGGAGGNRQCNRIGNRRVAADRGSGVPAGILPVPDAGVRGSDDRLYGVPTQRAFGKPHDYAGD